MSAAAGAGGSIESIREESINDIREYEKTMNELIAPKMNEINDKTRSLTDEEKININREIQRIDNLISVPGEKRVSITSSNSEPEIRRAVRESKSSVEDAKNILNNIISELKGKGIEIEGGDSDKPPKREPMVPTRRPPSRPPSRTYSSSYNPIIMEYTIIPSGPQSQYYKDYLESRKMYGEQFQRRLDKPPPTPVRFANKSPRKKSIVKSPRKKVTFKIPKK